MSYQQEAPFAVQIELTEGCNLRCGYCGLNGIREKGKNDFKFLTLDLARKIAVSIAAAGWNPRIEFAMHGEPTMNPQHLHIFGAFRDYLPKAYLLLETNGSGIWAKGAGNRTAHIRKMFEAGLDTVGLDQYQNIKFVPEIMTEVEHDWADFAEENIGIFYYPETPNGNPHQRNKKKRLVRIAPIDLSTKGTHSSINNHAGTGAPPDNSVEGKPCAKPFREMSIRWDGSVALCCNDWRGVYKCGSANKVSVLDIWNNDKFQAARRKLVLGQRDFGVCKGCNATSYRTGLLPDKKGKVVLPAPTKADDKIIAGAVAGEPYTAAIQRPWEK